MALITEQKSPRQYYRPANFGSKVLSAYDVIIKKILENHSQAIQGYSKYLATQAIRDKKPFNIDKLKIKADDLCRSLLPVSTLIEVETEREFAELLEETDSYSKKIGNLLPNIDSDPPKSEIKLVGHSPRNEFEVLETILFANSDQSETSIKRLVDELSYEKKSKLLKDCLDQDLDISYQLTISCEFRQLFDLLNDVGGKVTMQSLTPRGGYDVPGEIENAGLAGLYQQAFDLSLELYSLLQAAGFESQAQYAVLLGHRIRCKLSLDYSQVKKLLSGNQNLGYKSLTKDIKQQVSSVHPLVWMSS